MIPAKRNPLMMPLLLAGLLLVSAAVQGQQQPETTVLGTRMKMASKFLNEEREFIVTLPAGYENSQEKYPLLILLDSDSAAPATVMTAFLARCGHIPPLIVVSVITPSPRHHYRDFTPIKVDYLPASGGADNFLCFLNQELIPLLESRYRCHPFRILSGHGLSGLFALYALLTSPETAGAYLATSPSIAFADHAILPLAKSKLAGIKRLAKFVFMAAGREKVTVPAIREWVAVLKANAPEGLEWQSRIVEEEDQGSIALIGFYQGIKALYADWRFPAKLAGQGLPAIDRHCRMLSRKYGYEIAMNEDLLIKRSTQLFQEQDFEEALRMLDLGAAAYPESIPMRYWLGFVYEKLKDLGKAQDNYELAFQKAKAARHPMADFYGQQAARLAAKRREDKKL